ncbi:uroporphyrinogen-III synthase [Chromobacterium violaceum]|uniref:Uroporphyrinogen-III synthase n=1 Tax=Chromobacterium violaceum TaxID=536 RepID=A0A447T459_CHRVL|nr:uroporphyrinogen-III synthase [Chromobacterium violaceum]
MDFSGKRLACVGAASARRLADLSGRPVLHPTAGSDSEALLALPELADASGQRWLIVRGQGGRPLLADTLAARARKWASPRSTAASTARRTGPPSMPPADAVIITSGEMVEQLFRLAGPRRTGRYNACYIACRIRVSPSAWPPSARHAS